MPVNDLDIIRLSILSTLTPTDLQMHVFHLRANFAASQADADVVEGLGDFAAVLFTDVEDHLAGVVGPAGTRIYNVTQDRPLPSGGWTWDGGQAGSEALPSQIAIEVILRTGVKRTVGRKYFSGIASDSVNGNILTDPCDLAFENLGDSILDGYIMSPNNTFVCGTLKLPEKVFNPFISHTVSTVVCTQRRRKQGVGI